MKSGKMTIFVSALEPSSNLHLKNLIAKLPQYCEIIGVCDRDVGRPLFLPSQFSIMGFTDVLQRISFLRYALKTLSFEASVCDQVLLMDSSSFNIRLAKLIRKQNPRVTIMYYILPQVWAWKAWRAKEIEELCDKLACIWPFELQYYTSKAKYVGHPLLDIYTQEYIYQNDNLDSKVFVFMPGSRKSEIKKLMKEYIVLAKMIKKKYDHTTLRLIIPLRFKDTAMMNVYGDLTGFELYYDTQEGLKNASFAFVCAGTATLEASLMQIPFVLVYKAKWIDYIIAKMFVQLNFVGLANIIYQAMQLENGKEMKKAGLGLDYLHEELLQRDCKASKMLQAYENFDYQRYFDGVSKLRSYLKHGSAKRVAKWILSKKNSNIAISNL